MSGSQRIFKVSIIIIFPCKHAHAALCQIGIITLGIGLGHDQYFLIFWQIKCKIKTGTAASCN